MTLGLEVIKFLLEQDPDNLPVVQRWIDKWTWRGVRVLTLVGMMMDYMLPKRVMSWKEAWEVYVEQNGGALFRDLERYGIRPPRCMADATEAKSHISHQAWATFYQYGAAAAFHTWIPEPDELDWLSAKYPESFDRYYRPRLEFWGKEAAKGNRFYNATLPMLCQICQIPMIFTEPGDPTKLCYRESEHRGDRFHFCSEHCKAIFDHEPEKYVQAWLPVHQIYQGNYYHQRFLELAARHRSFTYVPALSHEPEGTGWTGRRGFVHDAAKVHFGGDFRGHQAYLCGPPPMIEACIRTLMQGRLFEPDIHTEKFISAADAGQARSPLFRSL